MGNHSQSQPECSRSHSDHTPFEREKKQTKKTKPKQQQENQYPLA